MLRLTPPAGTRSKTISYPNIKKVCEEPSSETKLFGDNLEDNIKKMKESTTTLTTTSNPRPFLFNRGGGINNNKQQPNYRKKAKHQGTTPLQEKRTQLPDNTTNFDRKQGE
jgi:hypothetical protein